MQSRPVGDWHSFCREKGGDGRWALVECASGQRVVAETFLSIDTSGFVDGLLSVLTSAGYGFIDRDGRWAIRPQFEHADQFADGRAKVISDGRVGYIDKSGRYAIAPRFDWGTSFSNGVAVVGVLTLQGKLTRYISDSEHDMRFHVIDRDGNFVDPGSLD